MDTSDPTSSTDKSAAKTDLTPLMRQYAEIKSRNPDALLLYRMGDFYELFNEDARVASKILGLTLTTRNNGSAESTPLAGFPHHALERYANRLVKAGYKIAVCEQTEDPKAAKGIVKRDVIEVITAGTAVEGALIEDRANNFITGLCRRDGMVGIATCDLSTGQFEVEEMGEGEIGGELARVSPSEILVPDDEEGDLRALAGDALTQVVISRCDGWKFSLETAAEALREHFAVASLDGWGLEGAAQAVRAAGALVRYLKEQKKNELRHITAVTRRRISEYADLDPSTIRNLELLRPLHADETGGTLVSVLDRTGTAMGSRLLKRYITRPLKDIGAIQERLGAVEWLRRDTFARSEIELFLKRVADIERLIGRVTFERATPRDLDGLRCSLEVFPSLIRGLAETPSSLLKAIAGKLSGFETITTVIAGTLVDNPPHALREGGIIRRGVSAELDEIREMAGSGKQWIARLQESERARTGISSLKVGFNRVFGYYLEVSKSNLNLVPQDYIRKQTLANGERFITPELKEMETKVLGAEDRLGVLEYDLFVALRASIAKECVRIQEAAAAVAMLDVFVSLSRVAAEHNYVRPVVTEGADLVIRDGRHPVVECMVGAGEFVPNDTEIIRKETQIFLITGPNMAGKSTYLRQNALICIMAQIGSFVPASFAQIGVVDRFFTRVGASDRLARGQSTFLVEMIEVANILNNATDRSFVLLDEVGRGTSTFDGISIAWAVAEFLHETALRRARTLFATHYHELTEMALLFPRIKNMHIKVKEWNDQIIFLRKIDAGSCDHSYGIQVARLAGVPKKVLIRAREILSNLENMELTPDHKPVLARHREKRDTSRDQTDLFTTGVQLNLIDSHHAEVVQQLQNLDVNGLTPLDALNLLSELKKKAQ